MHTDPTRAEVHADLDGAVEQAIAACDGDARATVRALIIANDFLHAELERIKLLISRGFARGKLTLRDLP